MRLLCICFTSRDLNSLILPQCWLSLLCVEGTAEGGPDFPLLVIKGVYFQRIGWDYSSYPGIYLVLAMKVSIQLD